MVFFNMATLMLEIKVRVKMLRIIRQLKYSYAIPIAVLVRTIQYRSDVNVQL